jgi:hypothetical protein
VLRFLTASYALPMHGRSVGGNDDRTRRSPFRARLACESSQPDEPPEHAKLACDWQAGVSLLGCQLRRPNSLVEGAMWAAGRSLPDMSLAFALMAAINGSTGSCATLSHGL